MHERTTPQLPNHKMLLFLFIGKEIMEANVQILGGLAFKNTKYFTNFWSSDESAWKMFQAHSSSPFRNPHFTQQVS